MAKRASEGFEANGRPEDVANYRRLVRSRRVHEVLDTLRRRKVTDREAEILLRLVSGIPRDWRDVNRDTSERRKRRAALARKLSLLADEVDEDPDFSELRFGPNLISSRTPPEDRDGLMTLADAMRAGAAELELDNLFPSGTHSGKSRSSATRKLMLQSYALLAIFDLLEPHFKRAPNRETEILASVLLEKTIKPGTVTQLRKGIRRSYFRDEK